MIRIFSDTPVNEKSVKEKIREYYVQEKDDIDFAMKRLTLKEIVMGVLGIALLAIWLYISATQHNIRVEILSIMSWVAIWEAVSIVLVERPELRRLQRCCEQLIKAEIEITTQN